MEYKIKRQLKKLGDKKFAEDIKEYIKSSHDFYGVRVPELSVLAKKLHGEQDLKKFYKVFNKLWKSGYHEEMSLAIYTLQLYEKDFDMKTWKFIKSKLKDMNSWDQIDSVAVHIIGPLLIKYPSLESEIIKLAKSMNMWHNRLAIVSTLPLIRKKENQLAMKLIDMHLYSKEDYVQKAVGWMLRDIGDRRPEMIKRYILKHIDMPSMTFIYATEHMKALRKVRKLKKLKGRRPRRFLFWRY
jgi:3-methyladenine DNA glycosylase AlkD